MPVFVFDKAAKKYNDQFFSPLKNTFQKTECKATINRFTLAQLIKEMSYESRVFLKRNKSKEFPIPLAQIKDAVNASFAQSKGLLLLLDYKKKGQIKKNQRSVPKTSIDSHTTWSNFLPASITNCSDLPLNSEQERALSIDNMLLPKMINLISLTYQFSQLSTLKVVMDNTNAQLLHHLTDLLVGLNNRKIPIVNLQLSIDNKSDLFNKLVSREIENKRKIAIAFSRLIENVFTENEKETSVVFPKLRSLVFYLGKKFFYYFSQHVDPSNEFAPMVKLINPENVQLSMFSRVEQAFFCLPHNMVQANLDRLRRNPNLQSFGLLSCHGEWGEATQSIFDLITTSEHSQLQRPVNKWPDHLLSRPQQPLSTEEMAFAGKLTLFASDTCSYCRIAKVPNFLGPHLIFLTQLQMFIPQNVAYATGLSSLQTLPNLTTLHLVVGLGSLMFSQSEAARTAAVAENDDLNRLRQRKRSQQQKKLQSLQLPVMPDLVEDNFENVSTLPVCLPFVRSLHIQLDVNFNLYPYLRRELCHYYLLRQFKLEEIFCHSLKHLSVLLKNNTSATPQHPNRYNCYICEFIPTVGPRDNPDWKQSCCRKALWLLDETLKKQLKTLTFEYEGKNERFTINNALPNFNESSQKN